MYSMISAIVLVAVIMGFSAVAPAMANVPPTDPPDNAPEDACDGLYNPSDENAAAGKAKAKDNNDCG